jgi:hypothetical protein
MTEPAASCFVIGGGPPRFPLDILRAMRVQVDALLSLLLSESNTETADDGAQIPNPPTKSVRRRSTARDAVPTRMIELQRLLEGPMREIAQTLVNVRRAEGSHEQDND